LAVGVLINGLAHIPFVLVQGAGRADVTGKLHLLELPLYVALLWWLTATHGVIGAAWAWTARVTADGAALFAASARLLNGSRDLLAQIGKLAATALVLGTGAFLVSSLVAKSVFLICGVLGFAGVFWRYVLEEETRLLLKGAWLGRTGAGRS
jgi:O-antigen/teichoic acid export membrane protein